MSLEHLLKDSIDIHIFKNNIISTQEEYHIIGFGLSAVIKSTQFQTVLDDSR